MPHHVVQHPRKGTLRVVFDCGATFRGVSLNTELLQGPNLTSTLLGVLMRFRQQPIACVGDIRAMFHQVTDFQLKGRLVFSGVWKPMFSTLEWK